MTYSRSARYLLACLCFAGISEKASAATNCPANPISTSIQVTSNPPLSTTEAAISLSGIACNRSGVGFASIHWVNGSSSGPTPASTTWNGQWEWRADDIPLAAGANQIDVTARDANGDQATASVVVNLAGSPPPQPAEDIARQKTKITIWFPETYTGLDRFNLIGYVADDFDMPFAQDVRITASVQSPEDGAELMLFDSTVPAGTVTGTDRRYLYRRPGSENSGSGIRELEFLRQSSGTVRLYIYVNNDDFLIDTKASLDDADYRNLLRQVRQYTVTVQVGNKAWVGVGAPVSASALERKVELRFNR